MLQFLPLQLSYTLPLRRKKFGVSLVILILQVYRKGIPCKQLCDFQLAFGELPERFVELYLG